MANDNNVTANNIVTLPEGENSALSISTADVKGMGLTDTGELVITLQGGDKLTITNFETLAENGVTLSMNDGSTIETRDLFETLAQDMPAKAIATPADNVIAEYDLLPGRKYELNFGDSAPQSVEEVNGDLVISFENNSQLILHNFTAAQDAQLPPELEYNGEFLSMQEFAEMLRLATVIDSEMTEEEILRIAEAQIEDTSKTEQELAELAEQLADIEPAAGEAGGGAAAARGGFGFQSTFATGPLGTIPVTGPIGPTALQFGLPEPQNPLGTIEARATGPTPPPTPGIESSDETVYEDGSVQLTAIATSNAGPDVGMTIVFSGIPAGWTVTAPGGTYDATTGTLTYNVPTGTTSYVAQPTFAPPADSDADLPDLTITVTNTDTTTGLTADVDTTIDIIVDAVADTPDLSATPTVGNEDQPVALDISTAVTDTDGSETITGVFISNVPTGFTLSAGTEVAPGTWQLTQAELAGLTISAPADFYGTITLDIRSVAEETNKTDADFDLTNDTAEATTSVDVTWQPVVDTPKIEVNGGTDEVRVKEDGSVDVTLVAELNTVDSPDAYLTVTVTGIDASWGFTAPVGTYDAANGTWTYQVPAGQNLSTVMTFTPPAQSDIDLTGLTATVTATEPATGTELSASDDFYITVDAVADEPNLTVNDVSGAEGATIAIDLNGSLGADTDGSEQITGYQIAGVPDGFAFVDGAGNAVGTKNGNVWSFTVAEAADLNITGPADYYGKLDLTATVFNTENPVSDGEYDDTDNDNSATVEFDVTWKPVVNPPTIEVNGGVPNADVKEDNSVTVSIEAALGDGHSASEVLTVTVTGIDSSWGFSSPVGTYDAATGNWTVVLPAGEDLSTTMTFTPPADSDIDLTGLKATASAYEPATDTTATAEDDFAIIVDAVADTPDLDADAANGEEGTTIPLTITTAVTDTDGSEVIEVVRISGVPTGASLTAGTEVAPGVWELSVADLAGLGITVPDGVVGTFDLTVESVAFEQNTSGTELDLTDNRATATETLTLTVEKDDVPVITPSPAKTVDETNLASGDLTTGGTVSANFGSDTPGTYSVTGSFASSTTLTSGGVAVTVTQTANGYVGTANGDTIFTLTLDADTGAYTYTQQGTLDHPDESDANDSITLQFGFNANDNDGDSAAGNITINVLDDGPTANNDVNEYETIDGGTTGNVITGENGGPGAADTLSQDADTTVTQVRFGGTTVDVPETGSVSIDGAHGTLTISADGSYSYVLNAASPTGGTVSTEPHSFDETLEFPTLTEGQEISGDTRDNLGINAGDLTVDHDGTGTVTFVSEGAGYKNTLGMYTVAADGTLQSAQVLIKDGDKAHAGDSYGFNAQAGETLGFFIIADGYNQNGGYAGIDFNTGSVAFVYKHGTADARPATINDDGADISLVFTSAGGSETVLCGAVYHTTERGGSENLNADGSVRVVSGLADDCDNGTLRIGFEDLPGLGDEDYEDIIFDVSYTGTVVTPGDCPEDEFTYVITDGDGDSSEATLTLDGKCPPVDVLLDVAPGAGDVQVKEDGSVFVPVDATYTGGNGNETMTLTVSGVGPGWNFSSTDGWTPTGTPGEYSITLTAGDRDYNGGFTLAPPADSDADLSGLTVTASVTGPDANDNDSATDSATVVVDAVIDTPTLTASDAAGEEGQTIALNISTAVTDTDGSESITKVTIEGLPAGATLNKGTENGGVWTLSQADLAGLTLTLPNDSAGTYSLTVTSYAEETVLSGAEYDLTDNATSVSKTLELCVEDDHEPIIVDPARKTVDETDLSATGPVVGGTINVNYGDDTPGAVTLNGTYTSTTPLTSGGVAVTVAQAGNVITGTAGGETIFTLTLNANGTYSFKLLGTLDHPNENNPNDAIDIDFAFTATDSDGDTANGTIGIRVMDDGVTAVNDVADYVVGETDATGNVLANDNLSNDLDNNVTKISFGSDSVDVPETGTVSIDGDYGTLTIDADGNYTYTPFASTVTGSTGTAATTITLDPNSGDVHGWQESFTKNGFTISIGEKQPGAHIHNGGDLKWHDKGHGAGIGIGKNGSKDNKVWPQGETLVVDPQENVSAMTFTLSDIGHNNVGHPLSVKIYFADGSSEVVEFDVPNPPPSNGLWDVTIDSADYAGGLITKADLYNEPGEGSVSFMLHNVTATVPGTPAANPCDEFVYTVTDGDGDSSTATLKIKGIAPELIVGTNTDDDGSSTTDHYIGGDEGTITGGAAGDILVGDIGGSFLSTEAKDYNIVLILDASGSMGDENHPGSRLSLLIDAVENLLKEFNEYDGGTIRVHLASFNTDVRDTGTFTVTNDSQLQAALDFLEDIRDSGFTNYEAALQQAIKYLDGDLYHKPLPGAENYTYFISDGEPNYYLNDWGYVVSNTNPDRSMDEIRGVRDSSNEIADLQRLSTVFGIGIQIGGNGIWNIDEISSGPSNGDELKDNTINVNDPHDLTNTLSGLNPLNRLETSGDDELVGGAGDDFIFGDSVNTDKLAQDQGLGSRSGEGWNVFTRLENGEGNDSGWTRQDTIDYIRNNAFEIGSESVDANGDLRPGGHDVIHGGDGNDAIFGQNGNDEIYGENGNDYIDGGSGNDVIYGGAGEDFIDGGAGNDTIYGGAGDDTLYGWTGDDVIYGGAGNDNLIGEGGQNTLYGGDGADTFWYLSATGGVDTIKDFNAAEGDALDIANLLDASSFNDTQAAIDDFVFARVEGGNTTLSVDLSGSGNAANGNDFAVLEGVDTSISELLANNALNAIN